jgi:hypothetical protein
MSKSKNQELLRAVHRGDVDRAGKLLAKGANANVRDSDGEPLLTFAARLGGPVPWFVANKKVDSPRVVGPALARLLLNAGADVDARSGNRRDTALMLACTAGELDTVKALLASGAEVNAANHYGWTALHRGTERHHVGVVRALLSHGADPYGPTDGAKVTPLQMGVASAAMLTAFLETGLLAEGTADRAGVGPSLLVLAAGRGSVDSVDLLLKLGVDVSAHQATGTALRYALELPPEWEEDDPDPPDIARVAVLRRLLDAGAVVPPNEELVAKQRRWLALAAKDPVG